MPNNLKIPPEFEAATNEQRIAFAQEVWDRIASDPASVPLPEAHKRILDQRMAENTANPAKVEPWDDVREALQNQLRSS